ncbi:hypothetical protein ABT369_32805 [Dactylosporangium sp. NPDC000244]|uniref:hypothetical protein n=1 Tax=Dactylosporangium sp. NPDC000244 TaxID=3154365 RepID=UPI003325366C
MMLAVWLAPRFGSHTAVLRPSASKVCRVVLPFWSTTTVCSPQAGSNVVVVVQPCWVTSDVAVTGPPDAGVYVVVVVLPRTSVAVSTRP